MSSPSPATTAAVKPRILRAPADPSLPKPWRGLIDSSTGFLYFWNPATNVTQYEKPISSSPPETPSAAAGNGLEGNVGELDCSQNQESGPVRVDSNEITDIGNAGKLDCPDNQESGSVRVDSSHEMTDIGNAMELDCSQNQDSRPVRVDGSHEITDIGNAGELDCPDNQESGTEAASPAVVPDESEHCGGDQTRESNGGKLDCPQNQECGPAKVDGRALWRPVVQAGQESGVGLSVEAYRRRHEITVIGANVPNPYITFDSTCFPSEILRELHQAGFSAPTPIQAQSWPIALQKRDIIAVAKTGSGKTIGYLLPGFIHLKRLNNDVRMGPSVLVLSPTRELATQIHEEAIKFGKSSRISCACLYGGAPKGPQLRDIERGVHVVVATPGRLNDILEMKRLNLDQVSYLVLDEADRMLDMGFEPQIRKIVKQIPTKRQTLMYTATWPKEVRKIASDLLVKPVQVNIGNVDELVANKSITQHVEVIPHMQKRRRLEQILRSNGPSKYIVFCSTKRMCDQLAGYLDGPFGASAIHGDKSQMERDKVLSDFRNGRSPILVATDVAARGLDIKDIRFVINYDFPTGVEDYVHRIGRTGRAGATGVAYTFFCDQDSKYASDLVKVLVGADQEVPSELREMASRGGYGGKSRRWASDSSYAHDDYGPSVDRYDQSRGHQESEPQYKNENGGNCDTGNGGGNSSCYLSFSPGPTDEGGSGNGTRSRSRSPNRSRDTGAGTDSVW